MKQLIQSFKTGATILEEVPAPQVSRGSILIQTTRSLVSLGTERMLVEFGKANLFLGSPAASSKAAMLAACPMQIVVTSFFTYCMVS